MGTGVADSDTAISSIHFTFCKVKCPWHLTAQGSLATFTRAVLRLREAYRGRRGNERGGNISRLLFCKAQLPGAACPVFNCLIMSEVESPFHILLVIWLLYESGVFRESSLRGDVGARS
jgi:hypothetical protein